MIPRCSYTDMSQLYDNPDPLASPPQQTPAYDKLHSPYPGDRFPSGFPIAKWPVLSTLRRGLAVSPSRLHTLRCSGIAQHVEQFSRASLERHEDDIAGLFISAAS